MSEISPTETVALGALLNRSLDPVELQPTEIYKQITVRMHHNGVVLRGTQPGSQIGSTRQYRARAGQLILSRIDARNGAIGLVTADLDGAIVTNDFWLFDIDKNQVIPAYLDYYVGTRSFIDLCKQASEGTTNRVRLQPDQFLTLPIPLPPLAEQRRIVARIEALAARIEALAARIEEARERRREAVEEAEVVHGAAWSALLGNRPQFERLPIESIAEVRGGIQKGPHREAGSHPTRYLTVAHVHRNRITTTDPRFFEVNPAELERWRLIPGDVLVIEGNGSADQIGRTALFRGEIENCVHQNHVIRVRPNRDQIEQEFLNGYLNSPAGQDEVQTRSRTTSGLRSLSVGRIKQITVPLPPLLEQRRMVAYLDEVQGKVEALKRLQAETAAELDALLPAVLDRAFRGEL